MHCLLVALKEMDRKIKIQYFLMSIAMLTWGMAWSSAKIVNSFLPYNELVFLRFLIGFISILPFIIKRPFDVLNIDRILWVNIVIVSGLFFVYNQ